MSKICAEVPKLLRQPCAYLYVLVFESLDCRYQQAWNGIQSPAQGKKCARKNGGGDEDHFEKPKPSKRFKSQALVIVVPIVEHGIGVFRTVGQIRSQRKSLCHPRHTRRCRQKDDQEGLSATGEEAQAFY